MKKIAVVYTSMGGLVTTLKKTLVDVTGCRVISIADDSLIQDVMKAGHITDSVRRQRRRSGDKRLLICWRHSKRSRKSAQSAVASY